MLTIYKTAESLLAEVKRKRDDAYPRTEEMMQRCELLRQMLNNVDHDRMVAVDEELFKFLNM